MNEATPEPRRCDICGDPILARNKSGICSNHEKTACMKERKRREAIRAGIVAHRIKISADDTFGRWTVLEDYSIENKRLLVRCECGMERRVSGTYLIHGRSTSCGCARKKPRSGKPPYLLAGAVFGRLTTLEDVTHCEDYARFRCECGGEITTKAVQVKLGLTRSCGCLRREMLTTHGFSKHPLYATWNGIIDRCTDPKNHSYHSHGGRGVTICDRWRHDPWLFAEDIEREIGPRPEGVDESGRVLYELDRIDNDGNYEPGNVRWADKKTQRANQRTIASLTAQLLAAQAELETFRAASAG